MDAGLLGFMRNVQASSPTAALAGSYGEVMRLAWPIASAMLGETIIGLVDTKLVGGLGTAALAGVGLANTVLLLSYIVVVGIMRGVKVCTAYAVGRHEAGQGALYAQVGMGLGALLGGVAGWALQDVSHILKSLHINSELIPYAQVFLATRAWALPAICTLVALTEYRQGLGDVRTPMVVGLVGNGVNGCLGYCLIYGHAGLPALGIYGGALGTAITEWLQLTVLLTFLTLRGTWTRRWPRGSWRRALREIIDVGAPTGLHLGFEFLAFAVFTAIIGNLTDVEVAAHQIAMAINRTAYLPGLAIAEAACILVSRALGAGDLRQADRVTQSAVRVAIAFMGCCGVFFAVFCQSLSHVFSSDPHVATLTVRLLWIATCIQIVDAINVVMRGALRGAKDVRVAAVIGIVIMWTCVPTAGWFLGQQMGWGIVGGWLGFVGETTLAAAVFSWRWRRGTWRQHFVTPGVAGAPSSFIPTE